jgi:uncharacterized protein (DUF2252 family)
MTSTDEHAAEPSENGSKGNGASVLESAPGSPVAHLTPAERDARGKAARTEVPRRVHAEWEPSSVRPSPVDLLEQQAATRVPELIPIRHGRMLVSAFTFYRGAALIMASDLAATPRSGLLVQLCGDAHLSNFGVFGTPERNMVFDINDFDETHPGPWEWDVKRLATSFEIAGRDNEFTPKQRTAAVLAAVEAYRLAMRDFATKSNLEVWYAHFDIEQALEELSTDMDASMVARTQATLAKARTKDSMRAFEKLTHVVDGERRIISDPPLIVPVEELGLADSVEQLESTLRDGFRSYRNTLPTDRRHLLEQYRFTHFARKVVGVGSVGTRAWIALFLGRDDGDPLFLQVKEAQQSVLEPFLGHSEFENSGERVVAGQRLMQASSDIFLGWHRTTDTVDGVPYRDNYIRQLHDWKGSADIEAMRPRGMTLYARLCGWTLARAHARSGDRIAIASYLGGGDVFDRAIAEFAQAYADQNERDYATLVQAVESGRLKAEVGV